MSETNSSGFSVLDMAQSYANENNIGIDDIFSNAQPKPVEEPKEELKPVTKASKMWVPDASLTEGMDELHQSGVVYNKEDVKEEEIKPLKNKLDDDAVADSRKSMDEMSRKLANIEDAKARHGISKLQIPEGTELEIRILSAAGDTDYERAKANLDELFNELINDYPQFILEWLPGYGDNLDGTNTVENNGIEAMQGNATASKAEKKESDEVKVIIDKRDVGNIEFNEDEAAKIRKSRIIELNIVESTDIKYSQIVDVPGNMFDKVLAPYQRKCNDISSPLPASKYRATFTGLAYTEIVDLQVSVEMSSIDAEWKKWSIAFNHTTNQSIGPWEEYRWYIDPVSKKKVIIQMGDATPEGLSDDDIHFHSKFEDFLQKTSYKDLDFILWKVLCASAHGKEIVNITCHNIVKDKECGTKHDWLYDPNDLLIVDTINTGVLEDMRKAAEAVNYDEIMAVYNTSFLRQSQIVELPRSGMSLEFGHASAYDYLNTVFPMLNSIRNLHENDPSIATRTQNTLLLSTVKGFLIPMGNGQYGRVYDPAQIVNILDHLDPIDYEVTEKVLELVNTPYVFKYAIRNIVCPKCKSIASLDIEDMSQLVFIIAQSLGAVSVTLTKL